MNKIKFIIETLNTQIPENIEGFLNHENEFQFLIAVMLSANCSDKMVNRVTKDLFKKFPTSFELSKANFGEVSSIIKPCGQWRNKTKRLIDTSYIIENNHKGIVPYNKEILKTFPGVGEKTASVFLSQKAKDKNQFPVDRHIIRLSNRWGISFEKNPDKVSEDLKSFFINENWITLHLKMIQFGRLFCKPILGNKSTFCNCTICKVIGVKK